MALRARLIHRRNFPPVSKAAPQCVEPSPPFEGGVVAESAIAQGRAMSIIPDAKDAADTCAERNMHSLGRPYRNSLTSCCGAPGWIRASALPVGVSLAQSPPAAWRGGISGRAWCIRGIRSFVSEIHNDANGAICRTSNRLRRDVVPTQL